MRYKYNPSFDVYRLTSKVYAAIARVFPLKIVDGKTSPLLAFKTSLAQSSAKSAPM